MIPMGIRLVIVTCIEDLTSINLLINVLGFIRGRLLTVMLVSVVARLKKRFALKC